MIEMFFYIFYGIYHLLHDFKSKITFFCFEFIKLDVMIDYYVYLLGSDTCLLL